MSLLRIDLKKFNSLQGKVTTASRKLGVKVKILNGTSLRRNGEPFLRVVLQQGHRNIVKDFREEDHELEVREIIKIFKKIL